MMNDIRTEKLTSFCQEMIRTPSYSGQEGKVAELLSKTMKEGGFHSVHIDRYGNVVGRILLGKGGKKILLEGHMDHVGISDPGKWKHDPFGADLEDGKIFGRGTSDMKGNLAAMTMAAIFLMEDSRGDLDGEIIVAGSVHEECFEGVASQLIGEDYKPDYVIIGEASSLNLKRGQRGRAEVVLETLGKTAHSSNPSVGLNAVKKMMKVLSVIEQKFTPAESPILGKGILEVTDIISSPYPGASVVPDLCRVTFDRRLLVGEMESTVLGQIQEIIDEVAEYDPELKTKLYLAIGEDRCYTEEPIRATRFAPAWLFSEDHPFVQDALAGLKSVGQQPELSHYYFCTNGSYYAGKEGIPTIGYGGSLESLAHVDDEYIEIEQLVKACEGYYGIVRSVFS